MKAIGIADPTRTDGDHFRRVEASLATGRVAALKGYLGYLHFEPAHPNYRRYYDLAAKYKIPVMFYTGDTYSPWAKLKYAHPLGVDDVAVDHPNTNFVMCHIGNPWTTDAAEVIYKNMNVWADLSGLLVGTEEYLCLRGRAARQRRNSATAFKRAIRYSERPNRFLYGTDWPLALMAAYRDFIFEAIPADLHEQVFDENARALPLRTAAHAARPCDRFDIQFHSAGVHPCPSSTRSTRAWPARTRPRKRSRNCTRLHRRTNSSWGVSERIAHSTK
ncbi:MAG: amidohydrolase family protein [Gemmataceae bacterium]